MNLLCEDYRKAKLNRQRVRGGYCNRYYEAQARAERYWKEGLPPSKLRIGELPQVHLLKHRTLQGAD